jgi:hypothetical protein
MIIKNEKPPAWIYDACIKQFDISKNTVWTFADTIYNPDNADIPIHLIVHETTHAEQQQHNEEVATAWWKRYLADPQFRVEQEIEAYHNQYKFICTKVKDRNAPFKNLHILAQFMCEKMYGNCISYTDAIRRIREG